LFKNHTRKIEAITFSFFSLGIHHLLNVSTFKDGIGGGILIRAIEPTIGVSKEEKKKGNGPGKFTKLFGLKKEDCNNVDVTTKEAGFIKTFFLFPIFYLYFFQSKFGILIHS
jgi:3-methyladenine DNA glycosylase Mpg